MCVWMTGLRSNISETEGGTNLGLQDDQNLSIIPESQDEKDPNSVNWALSANSRNKRFIIGEPDWDPKIQWKINKERYDRIRTIGTIGTERVPLTGIAFDAV